MTSSSKTMGVSPVSWERAWASASFKASTALRCCPWEPYIRAESPPKVISKSSRWGPTLVKPERTSEASVRRSSVLNNSIQSC